MRTKKMVRHNKRHSRKRGGKSGKRSRGRRQSGGMWKMTEGWKSLITADENMARELPSLKPSILEWKRILIDGLPVITSSKGIDIKYMGSPPDRKWLIGGKEHTVEELFNGEKGGRYMDVIKELRDKGVHLPDEQKGIILTDEEFCRFFIRYLIVKSLTFEHMMRKPLAYKYFDITSAAMHKIGSDAVSKMCSKWDSDPDYAPPPPPMHMLAAQRHHRASAAAPPPPPPPPADLLYMGESHVSEGIDAQRRRFHSNSTHDAA